MNFARSSKRLFRSLIRSSPTTVREVLVYPNPASNYITIEIPQPLASGGEWSLYNGVGQRVVLQPLARGATRVEVPLSGVPPGLYFWEMRGGEARKGSGKLMVLQ